MSAGIRFRNSLRALLMVLVAALALAAPRAAHAQYPAVRPTLLDLETLVDVVTAAQVSVPRSELVAAYLAYLDGFEQLYAHADAEYVKVAGTAGNNNGVFLSPRDTTRSIELIERTRTDSEKLVKALFERVKQAATENASNLDRADELINLGTQQPGMWDFSTMLRWNPWRWRSPTMEPWSAEEAPQSGDAPTEDERIATWKLQFTKLDERKKIVQDMHKSTSEAALVRAQRAEKAGLVGRSREDIYREIQDAWSSMRNESEQAQREAMERAQALQRTLQEVESGMWEQYQAVHKDSVKVQWEAYLEIEERLPERVKNRMIDTWMPRMFRRHSSFGVEGPSGVYIESPRDLIREVLRIKTLTPEQRETARTAGRKLIDDYRKSIRDAVAEQMKNGGVENMQHDGSQQWRERANELFKSIGLQKKKDQDEFQTRVPEGDLLEALSEQDSQEFGRVVSERDWERFMNRRYFVDNLRPVAPHKELAPRLISALGVEPSLQPIVEIMATELQDKWGQQVGSMVKEFDPKWTNEMGQSADYESLWRAEVARSYAARRKAYALSEDLEKSFYDGLRAAIGGKANMQLLAIAALAPRTERSDFPRWQNGEYPLDIPRAVLEGPLTPTTRQKLAAEFEASVENWSQLAARTLAARIAWDEVGTVGDRNNAEQEGANAELTRRVKESNTAVQRAREAWASAEAEISQRLSDIVPADEADAWRAYVKSQKWPTLFPDMSPVRAGAERALEGVAADAPECAAVLAIVRSTEEAIVRTGDIGVVIAKSYGDIQEDPQNWNGPIQSLYGRLHPIMAISAHRRVLATEAIRNSLPQEYATKLKGRSTFDRAQVAATAATVEQ